MSFKPFRFLIIPALGGIICSSSPVFLSSCSFEKPDLFCANDGVQNFYDHSFNVQANFRGYYSNDVYANVSIPTWYRDYIVFYNHNESHYESRFAQEIVIHFTFKNTENCQEQIPFNIEIDWYVKHTSVHKKTIEKIIPQADNVVQFKNTYFSTSTPTMINKDIQPEFKETDTDNNSFSCVNGYYNNQPYSNGTPSSIGTIHTNIENDAIYFNYLVCQTLNNLLIAQNSILGKIYISLDITSWNMDLAISYNISTQTFNYIQFNITATGDWKTPLGTVHNVATLNLNYAWGNSASDVANGFGVLKQFDKSCKSKDDRHPFIIPDNVGPKLLGAYSIYRGNNYYLQHQSPDANAPFYTQNFLSLVPSASDTNNVDPTKNSYQFYDVSLLITNSAFELIIGKYISSGYHIYFGKQPRMFGLELISGSKHLSIHSLPVGQDNGDSFANLGLALPSFSLTNVLDQQYKLPTTIPNISKCKVNIDTISPQITNKSSLYKGTFTISNNVTSYYNFLLHFFDAYNDIIFPHADQHFKDVTDTSNENYPGYGDFIYDIKGPKSSSSIIDPYVDNNKNLFDKRLKDLSEKTQSVTGGWANNVSITYDASSLNVTGIPWWQVIQVPSQRIANMPPDAENGKNFGCFVNSYDIGSWPNIGSYDSTNKFSQSQFAVGLNYMFDPSLGNKINEDLIDNWNPRTIAPDNYMADNTFVYQGTYLSNITYSDS